MTILCPQRFRRTHITNKNTFKQTARGGIVTRPFSQDKACSIIVVLKKYLKVRRFYKKAKAFSHELPDFC